MKKFLIIQLRPEDETSDNEYEAFLRYGELDPEETERIRVEHTGIPPLNLDAYNAIIVGGSPFDICTPEKEKTATQKLIEADFKRLFDEVVTRDFPFLGACSGSGLLGHYCGANISPKYGEAVGGVNLNLTAEGKNDPLLRGLPDSFRVLLGHKEACDNIPPGSTLLASTDTCPVQMFRIGKNVYATQFHPEADPSVFIVRIEIYKHHGYFPAETAQSLIEAVESEDTPHAHTILRRFVERYRS